MNIFDSVMGHQFIETFNRKVPTIANDIKSINIELRIANALKEQELISKGVITKEQANALREELSTKS